MSSKENKLKTTKTTKTKTQRKPRGSRDMLAEKYAKNLRTESDIIEQKFDLLAARRKLLQEQNQLIKEAMDKRNKEFREEQTKLLREKKDLKTREKKAARNEVS